MRERIAHCGEDAALFLHRDIHFIGGSKSEKQFFRRMEKPYPKLINRLDRKFVNDHCVKISPEEARDICEFEIEIVTKPEKESRWKIEARNRAA